MILQIVPQKILSLESERKTNMLPKKYDFSNIKFKNEFIYNYKPNSFLKETQNIINPFISFKLVLNIVLLDIKGKVGFIDKNSEGICEYLDQHKIKYSIQQKGPYYYLSLKKTITS